MPRAANPAWWIRQASGRAFNEVSRVIHVPALAISSLTQLSNETREESASPAPDVLAARTGLSVKEVLVLQPHVNGVSSLSAPASDVGEMSRVDTLADRKISSPEEEAEKAEIGYLITDSLRYLDRREREILTLRFGLGEESPRHLTLDEIGRIHGISRERIRQIITGALAKLERVSLQKGTSLNILRQLI